MNLCEFKGRRVKIRPPLAEDHKEFTSLVRSSRRFLAHGSSPPVDARRFAEYLARNRRDNFVAFLLCDRKNDRILGAVDLSQMFHGNFKSAYLGYWIGAPFARQGYMREGLEPVLKAAFGILKLHRVEANIQPENIPSRALAIALGFHLEGYSPRYLRIGGHWRDHERWALLREDWANSRRRIEKVDHKRPSRRNRAS
jgi:ribosomal-protein-alanine N-acetyltransferase